MKGVGLLFHLSELGVVLYRALSERDEFDFLLVSEKKEQNPGLWDRVEAAIPPDNIRKTDSYRDFHRIVEEQLETPSYSGVIVLTQGLLQFHDLIALKKRHNNRLWLYARLNSFRNGSIYRVPLTYYYSRLFVRYANYVNFQCAYTADIFTNSSAIFDRGIGGSIPLGLSVEALLRPPSDSWVDQMEEPDALKLVYLAQFHKHKRHTALINALVHLLRNNKSLKLFLFGDGVLYESLRKLTEQKGLKESVLMPGRIDRKYIPWVLDEADIAIVLSGTETFGYNILEPLFYGTPVISTDVGIAREVVNDFDTGFLLRADSFESVRKHIEYFIDNQEAAKIMGQRAMRMTRERYSWESIADRYLRLFDSIDWGC
jgi:glycosyltransferase involved in cell wall biosynthesis